MNKKELTYNVRFMFDEFVRVIDDDYIVLEDVFKMLGRSKKKYKSDLKEVKELLSGIEKKKHIIKVDLTYLVYKKSDLQEIMEDLNIEGYDDDFLQNCFINEGVTECISMNLMYLVISQFRPSNLQTKKLDKWKRIMKFYAEMIKSNRSRIDDIVFGNVNE